ncbi:Mitochondrial inner membrane peptidase complex subunit [Komagataella phaffii CBS 7435]|uniref:Mitochondrial inner membrane protease subunit n=2 Tax=Komagataella phaffii TaxID=460519 RepID=C4QVN8_KOMPG|nr:Catalytic subunit of the mitochondrial inner membrane peptidase complex [Komagataella phaffii GS115]AOA60515.1 GQ67_02511T0 [Komagataella phaffii]CAH2445968.1 Mitochondrial inner membrane peptidase complex subunit [Komagataella phaffii CBS 7435]AOA66454.1 GQ68_02736T0 [Komagataella phaffii GS115]CAY67311.1 Catalytic subunit of the mitochondrial inner membrane peptidase complex [Komagataella phaffii GS115]CCA36415.1 Mitochondrial inner membrane peptidase complex subunit [Komagataella phaffii
MDLTFLRTTLSWTLRAGCLIHFFHSHVYEFKETRGESMLPTLQARHDYVHTLKNYKFGRNIQTGDIIVALKPTDPDQRVCKRITGMPGDIVLIDPSSGSLEKDKSDASSTAFERYIVIPDGHVWLTGDNLSHSLDSRTYSVLPMGLIKGKIVAANDMNKSWKSLWGFRWIEGGVQRADTPSWSRISPSDVT